MVAVVGLILGLEGDLGGGAVDGVGADEAGEFHFSGDGEGLVRSEGAGDGVGEVAEFKLSPSCVVAEVVAVRLVGAGADQAPEWAGVVVHVALPTALPGACGIDGDSGCGDDGFLEVCLVGEGSAGRQEGAYEEREKEAEEAHGEFYSMGERAGKISLRRFLNTGGTQVLPYLMMPRATRLLRRRAVASRPSATVWV